MYALLTNGVQASHGSPVSPTSPLIKDIHLPSVRPQGRDAHYVAQSAHSLERISTYVISFLL